RRQRKGFEALSRGLLAVSAGHGRQAEKLGAKARKLLPDEPLTLLLQAQSAELKGDTAGASNVYRSMLDREETQALGLHGLFLEARRVGDMQVAKVIAERAVRLEPDSPWGAPALMELQSAEGDWVAASQTLARQKQHHLVSRDEYKRQMAVLLTAQAMEAEENNPEKALELALSAHKGANDLVPAAVIAGRLLAQKGRIAKAAKVLERTWKLAPHPDLAEVYAHLKLGDKPAARFKRIRFLTHRNKEHLESCVALARAAISARQWAAAREALDPFRQAPTQRVCALMAEIEDGEFGDKGKVREWLSRALRAARDPVWIADGRVSAKWAPVSPVTGKLDAFVWKAPLDELPPSDQGGSGNLDDGGEPAPEAPEIELVAQETPQEDGPAVEPEAASRMPASQTDEPEGKPAKEALEIVKPDETGAQAEIPEKAAGKPVLEIIPPHQPDDPGPEPDEKAKMGGKPALGAF
ncbi:MAG TPA: hypothetical protein ENJ57_07395, partial [Rhizobiales bacterium]|nr:hypothetical protein [Hyphomicrobiales bacterium]